MTDAATGEGILRADGVQTSAPSAARRARTERPRLAPRTVIKKFLNAPRDAVSESLDGALRAFPEFIVPIDGSQRAIRSRAGARDGKVGLVVGYGAGHEPCFLGYVGRGLADAVAVGNVFASPPPDRGR